MPFVGPSDLGEDTQPAPLDADSTLAGRAMGCCRHCLNSWPRKSSGRCCRNSRRAGLSLVEAMHGIDEALLTGLGDEMFSTAVLAPA